MKIDLGKVFLENITYYWKNKIIFEKERPHEILSVRTHTQAMHTHAYCMRMYARACIHMHKLAYIARILETI